MTTLDDAAKAIDAYFGDTSRSQSETADGLESIVAHCRLLIETLDVQDEL